MPKLPNFSEEELTPNVLQLLEVSHYQRELIQALRDEVAQLKGNKAKPRIRPSNMDKDAGNGKGGNSSNDKKRSGSSKKKKTKELKIHKKKTIKADDVPAGSEFKGYKEFVVQDIEINPYNTLYRMERWKTPSGNYVVGKLPSSLKGHFGSKLVSYTLYQYYQCHVTQPLLLEELHEFGVDISSGQINNILIGDHDDFHAEKDEILSTGLEISPYIQTDDTGARHKGKNGYCTHIGNEFFAWFESTGSKSRINFLKLLRAGNTDYVLNADAIEYMGEKKLPKRELQLLKSCLEQTFGDEAAWQQHLNTMEICKERHVKIATEGALLGAVTARGFNKELVVLSDDAGQFNVLLHALCWIHA
ncbi:Mobile element protein, partial [hydrothermal vent metagenome]